MTKYLLAVWVLAKENPVGFAVVWMASGLQTMATTAYTWSLAYPGWARDLTSAVIDKIPVVWEVVKEVAVEILSNPP